jgi:hypothetical protein
MHRRYANGYALNLSSLKQLHWFEVSAEDVLSIWPPERALGTAKSGRSKKIHFETLEAAFRLECEEKGNPEDEGPKGWQRQADVAKWVLSFASDKEIEISDSTAKKYATDLMERLGRE